MIKSSWKKHLLFRSFLSFAHCHDSVSSFEIFFNNLIFYLTLILYHTFQIKACMLWIFPSLILNSLWHQQVISIEWMVGLVEIQLSALAMFQHTFNPYAKELFVFFLFTRNPWEPYIFLFSVKMYSYITIGTIEK